MVLKELILTVDTFGWVWWSSKNDFLTVSILGGCGGLERTHFQQFLHCEAVVILKDLILTVSTFGGYGGLQRINF